MSFPAELDQHETPRSSRSDTVSALAADIYASVMQGQEETTLTLTAYNADGSPYPLQCYVRTSDDTGILVSVPMPENYPQYFILTSQTGDPQHLISETETDMSMILSEFMQHFDPESKEIYPDFQDGVSVALTADEADEGRDYTRSWLEVGLTPQEIGYLFNRIFPSGSGDTAGDFLQFEAHLAAAMVFVAARHHAGVSEALEMEWSRLNPQEDESEFMPVAPSSGMSPDTDYTGKLNWRVPASLVGLLTVSALVWGALEAAKGKVYAVEPASTPVPAETALPNAVAVVPAEISVPVETVGDRGVMLDVTPFEQDDARWALEPMGGDGFLGGQGCIVTALAQLKDADARVSGEEGWTPAKVNNKLKNNGGYSGNYYRGDSVLELDRNVIDVFNGEKIRNLLDNGQPLVIWLRLFFKPDWHYSVIRGWYEADGQYYYMVNGTVYGMQVWTEADLEEKFLKIFNFRTHAPVLEDFDFSTLPEPIK